VGGEVVVTVEQLQVVREDREGALVTLLITLVGLLHKCQHTGTVTVMLAALAAAEVTALVVEAELVFREVTVAPMVLCLDLVEMVFSTA